MPRGDRARIALDHGDVTVHHLLVLVEMPRGDNDALGCPDSLALRAIFGNDARDAALSVLNKVGDRAAGANLNAAFVGTGSQGLQKAAALTHDDMAARREGLVGEQLAGCIAVVQAAFWNRVGIGGVNLGRNLCSQAEEPLDVLGPFLGQTADMILVETILHGDFQAFEPCVGAVFHARRLLNRRSAALDDAPIDGGGAAWRVARIEHEHLCPVIKGLDSRRSAPSAESDDDDLGLLVPVFLIAGIGQLPAGLRGAAGEPQPSYAERACRPGRQKRSSRHIGHISLLYRFSSRAALEGVALLRRESYGDDRGSHYPDEWRIFGFLSSILL